MSHPEEDGDDDQPLNFGSDLSFKACIRNCIDGECCDLDHRAQEPDDPGGDAATAPHHHQPGAREPLLSIASSGRGPSQPRPVTARQYLPAQPMSYGSASYAGRRGDPERGAGQHHDPWSNASYTAGQGRHHTVYHAGVFIAPQFPPGFTTQGSSYQEGREVTPFQESLGWFRDGSGRLCNGLGEHINDRGEVLQPMTPSASRPAATSGVSDDESSHLAKSDGPGPSGGSRQAFPHHGSHHVRKQQNT